MEYYISIISNSRYLVHILINDKSKTQSPLDTLARRAIMVNQLFPQERVYLHFDNTSYYLGETMWFKAYVTSGLNDEERPDATSKRANVSNGYCMPPPTAYWKHRNWLPSATKKETELPRTTAGQTIGTNVLPKRAARLVRAK